LAASVVVGRGHNAQAAAAGGYIPVPRRLLRTERTTMPAVAESRKPFVIPSAAELDAIVNGLYAADNPVQEIELALLHATHQVEKPLTEFAKSPTLEDVGALYLFALAVENCRDNLQQWGKTIRGLLEGFHDLVGSQICRDCGVLFPYDPDAERCPLCASEAAGGDDA
jgi:hypothetical protein